MPSSKNYRHTYGAAWLAFVESPVCFCEVSFDSHASNISVAGKYVASISTRKLTLLLLSSQIGHAWESEGDMAKAAGMWLLQV